MTHGHALSWADTLKAHMVDLEAFLGPGKPFRDVSTADLSAALDAYAQTDGRKNVDGSIRPGRPSPSTVNRRLSVFSSIHAKARKEWKLPVEHIDFDILKREEPKVRVRHITRAEAKAVLKNLPPHIVLIVAWSLATGCRKNETKTLRWTRVNLETRQAEVQTKGGGTRFVDLGDNALQVLAECKRTGPYVFDFKNLRKHFDRALREAGIDDFRFHDLRHTFATWLGNAVGDIAVVMKALGHAQITTTMRYRHVMRTDVARGVQQLPMLLNSKVASLNNRLIRRTRRIG